MPHIKLFLAFDVLLFQMHHLLRKMHYFVNGLLQNHDFLMLPLILLIQALFLFHKNHRIHLQTKSVTKILLDLNCFLYKN